MLPTCRDGQLAVVNRLAYLFEPPQRGDVICIWTGQEYLIKRIIGLPGEEVAMREGVFYINGQPLREPYVQAGCDWTVGAGKLNGRNYAVAGDNRLVPRHQAVLAVARRDRIVGKLML